MIEVTELTIEQRLGALEIAFSTSATAHSNAIASVITAICRLPNADLAELKRDLAELKEVRTDGVDKTLYGTVIDLFISRVEHAQG